jgi:hypothetical protein
MALDFSEILVVAVSSRALFDLEKENEIFDKENIEGFRKYQLNTVKLSNTFFKDLERLGIFCAKHKNQKILNLAKAL